MIPYPGVVKKAIDRGQLQSITRRIEVYEADGVTPWREGLTDRLVDGGVSISYGDNERRAIDLTLRNDDNLLRSSPSGFWYDKKIKLFRGVQYSPQVVAPSTAIVDSVGGLASSGVLIHKLASVGLPDAEFVESPVVDALLDYDVIVSYTGTSVSGKGALLQALYNRGKNIITISNANGSGVVPYLTSTSSKTSTWGIAQAADPPSLGAGWSTETVAAATVGTAVMGTGGGAVTVARWTMTDSTVSITASVAMNASGGKWFDLHLPNLGGGQTARLLANVISWFKEDYGRWETQIGEFVIDGISNPHFPGHVKVTGRDYVKICANSKIENVMTFDAGTTVDLLVNAIAANAGITKFRLASMPETIGSTMSFDRGTPRWEIMVAAANTQGYEIFFDHEGYLTTRKYLDPTLSPQYHQFQTGVEGNLSTIDRAVNDSRIYNHIVVYGDPTSDEARLPYMAEALNTNPSSPTNISRLGDRYYSYASTFFTSVNQVQDYANRLLGLHSLESFELSFQAINYPWLEVGEIARVVDPKAAATDPDRYLIDSANIPLGLGPMSFTGKRVIMV